MVKPLTGALPSCAKYHPGEPSELAYHHAVRPTGDTYAKRTCRVCHRVRMHSYNRGVRQVRSPLVSGAPYGVVPLRWVPPEKLLEEFPCQSAN